MIIDFLRKIIFNLDRLFIWVYGSDLNPLKRSGALTVGILTSLLVSGVYLLFFYDVSAPYESMQEIEKQWYLGRWIRSFHRYASDVAVVVVVYHSISMLSKRMSWGVRTLAWVSGVGLMCALFVSGWTGFVMVWDRHGQVLAQEGARLFQLFPFLRDDLISAFSGQHSIPGSFFFMNLFLHVAVPLGMIVGLWVHTAKMGNVNIFPAKKVWIYFTLSLIVLSILWPAPLLEKGDLTRVVQIIPADYWYGFFIPLSQKLSPVMSMGLVALGIVVMITAPLWSRPGDKKAKALWFHRVYIDVSPLVLVRSLGASVIMLALVAFGSQALMKTSPVDSLIRFNFLLDSIHVENCRTPEAGSSKTLSHMMPRQVCDEFVLEHRISIWVDNELVTEHRLLGHTRDNRRVRYYLDHPAKPGSHRVRIEIKTQDTAGRVFAEPQLEKQLELAKGRVELVGYDRDFY